MKRKFIMVTDNYNGLGFAVWESMINNNIIVAYKEPEPKDDEKEEDQEKYDIQGEGFNFEKIPLDELIEKRQDYIDWYWIWDFNHNWEYAEKLIKENFKVFGGSQFSWLLENEREYAIEFAEKVGLKSPPHQEFKNWSEGIKFLETNKDKAYVFKPNGKDDSSLTTVITTPEPENANLELRQFIESVEINDFILQERIKGVEIDIEYFMQQGEPVIAQANLECKRRVNGDLGKMTGCAQDICWVIPLDCKLVQLTLAKFLPYLMKIQYTGFFDVNVMVNDDDIYFLEFCGRVGYNAHPNFFSTISKKSFFETAADLVDGIYTADNVKSGFGASITMRCETKCIGLPIYMPNNVKQNFYLFDGYLEDDIIKNGGFGGEFGIITAHNYTIYTAGEDCLRNAEKIKITNIEYRSDIAKTDYDRSPARRFEALSAMKII